MTYTISLTSDEELILQRIAAKRGRNPDELIRESVLQMLAQSEEAADDASALANP